MGKTSRTRGVLITATVLAVIVGAVVGLHVWSKTNQTQKTTEAFAAMRVVDGRIDLPGIIPSAQRTESGVEVRPLGSGPGPAITYAFKVSATPGWRARVAQAVEHAGYGTGGPPWSAQVQQWPIGITLSENDGTAYLVISTR